MWKCERMLILCIGAASAGRCWHFTALLYLSVSVYVTARLEMPHCTHHDILPVKNWEHVSVLLSLYLCAVNTKWHCAVFKLFFILDRIVKESSKVFEDVLESFYSIDCIKAQFEAWRSKYYTSYKDAYIGLCLPRLFAPLIRLQLLTWTPLEVCACVHCCSKARQPSLRILLP